MTTAELIEKIQIAYGKTYKPELKRALSDEMITFSFEQRDEIYQYLVKHTLKFPVIADYYNAARECGFLASHIRDTTTSLFVGYEPTSCRLCGGEGVLRVIKSGWFDEDTGKMYLRVERVGQYSRLDNDVPGPTYSFVYRCSCDAGDRKEIPKRWTKWRSGKREDEEEISWKRRQAGETNEDEQDEIPF